MRRRSRKTSGQTVLEFAIVLLLVLTVIFGVFETSRLMLTYATLAQAARAGVRDAIVHGADCVGGCTPTTGAATVQTVAGAAGITLANSCPPICVTYTYPAGAGTPIPGSLVKIVVTYTFAPIPSTMFPSFAIPLSSTSQGMVAY